MKKLIKFVQHNPDLAQKAKLLILGTKEMDFEQLYSELDDIQKMVNNKTVTNIRNIFDSLLKIKEGILELNEKNENSDIELQEIEIKIPNLQLSINGKMRRASILKIFCGAVEDKNDAEPDFSFDSEDLDNKPVDIKCSYNTSNGFEFEK